MKWLLPIVWGIKFYCLFWSREKREDYHLNDTLSSPILMGGNPLILLAEKVTTLTSKPTGEGRAN